MSTPTTSLTDRVEGVSDRTAERFVLTGVSWKTYESLLEDFADRSAPRFAYDKGTLEIMAPLRKHESPHTFLSRLISDYCLDRDIEIEMLGSTTFRLESLGRGVEPDECFYIQNAARVIGKESLDLTVDPPPDLVVEIDITSGSINKFSIYAALGVPEIWVYEGDKLEFFLLDGEAYRTTETSRAFPELSSDLLGGFVAMSRDAGQTRALKAFRQWLRTAS